MIHPGYLDPFFLAALAISSVIATLVALFIGVPIRPWRKSLGSRKVDDEAP
jgi:hypothetical protein